MPCTATSQLTAAPSTVLPLTMPQTPSQWAYFVARLQDIIGSISAASNRQPVNVVPADLAVYNGSALPALVVTGATASLDSTVHQCGAASLKLVANAATVTIEFSADPIILPPNMDWIESVYIQSSRTTIAGTLAISTPVKAYPVDISGSLVAAQWGRLYGDCDLTADDSTTATIVLTLTGCAVGDTFNLDGWQIEHAVGNTSLPSPFVNTTLPQGYVDAVDTASEALTAANAAQASANTANAQLTLIASDGNLSPAEKPTVIRDYAVLTTEQSGIDAQAVAFLGASSAQQVAYDGAISALTTYLGTLTVPTAWDDKSGNTTIVATTFEDNFNAVYTTRQTLLNAIYAQAQTLANNAQSSANTAATTALWTGVTGTGKPQDNADVTSLHTAADTAKVNGVLSTSISPIAGLMPAQAGADVTAAHASVGQNIVPNPGFESNVVGTPQETEYYAVGSPLSDGWYIQGGAQPQSDAIGAFLYWGAAHSGGVGLGIRLNQNVSIPSNNTLYYLRVCSGFVSVTAEDTLTWNDFYVINYNNGLTVPSGVTLQSSSGPIFWDTNKNYISDPRNNYNGPTGWANANGICTVPSNAAYVSFTVLLLVTNNSGSTWDTGNGYCDMFFDDTFISVNDVRQPDSAKAYINANDTTAGGHQGFTSYTSAVGIAGMVVEGDNLLDGDSVTFPVSFQSAPIILFGDGGLTYNPAWSTVAQYQNFSATLTPAGGPYTGFTASLQLCQGGSSSSAQTVDFSGENATLSVPSGDTIANGSLTVNGSVTNASPEPNSFTVTITDSSHSTVLATFDIGVPARSSIPYSKIVTDAAAVNGTVIQVTPAGATTVNYSTYIASASTSATPTGVPGVSWAAIATS